MSAVHPQHAHSKGPLFLMCAICYVVKIHNHICGIGQFGCTECWWWMPCAPWLRHFAPHCISHCCTNTPVVSQGNISTVRAKNGVEQMASEWLKPPTMVHTTSLSFSPTLPSFADFSLLDPPVHTSPSSRFTVAASSMPSWLTVLAKEARARWKPRGATQSQPRGEREEGGERDGEERWRRVEARVFCFVFLSPCTTLISL